MVRKAAGTALLVLFSYSLQARACFISATRQGGGAELEEGDFTTLGCYTSRKYLCSGAPKVLQAQKDLALHLPPHILKPFGMHAGCEHLHYTLVPEKKLRLGGLGLHPEEEKEADWGDGIVELGKYGRK
ncbi:unnamed protein product, partial [Symbiodinium sp. KB8]